jgi:hypothetical protein
MTKIIIALLSILMIYVFQVLAQNCILTGGPYSNKKKVVVKVNNTGFYPDCLIVRDGQSVVWSMYLIFFFILIFCSHNSCE